MSSLRQKRVAEQIQKVISERLIRGLRDPLPGFVTVRDVDVARDFSHARVFYSVIGTETDRSSVKELLTRQRGTLRAEVGRQVRLRLTPELSFIEDTSGERAARIHKLLAENAPAAPAPVREGAAKGKADDEDDDEEDEEDSDEDDGDEESSDEDDGDDVAGDDVAGDEEKR
jgi:ribosome-binding factor A